MSVALINHLLQTYGYLVVFVCVALESLGLPLPGETALIAAALYAGSTHRLTIGLIALVAAVAAIAGDNAGYWLGRQAGTRLVQRYGRRVGLTPPRVKVGRYLFARHGGNVVFYGRFVTVLRTYAAFFAGLNAMRWRTFVLANSASGVLWATGVSLGAYGLGNAANSASNVLTIGGLVLAGVLTVILTLVLRWRFRSLEERAEASFPDAEPAASRERTSAGVS